MKQVLQSLLDGQTEVADVPTPAILPVSLLVDSRRSLVSAGTERMLVEFGRAGWIEKARQQPDKVRMVWDKVRTDGLAPTLETVRNKLDTPLPMGYCNAGVVREVGAGVSGFRVGDRVASNGRHAEVVCVPMNLCARIPDVVSDDEAAFTVIGAIALQGIRLANPTLGESVVVSGLGLVGLIAVQLLRANGCRVLGIDPDGARCELARGFGAETVNLSGGGDPLSAARLFSRGHGVDAVIVTASTRSSEPIHQAAEMCRKRGRIVLVGVTGLELSRADFYEKELSFQVSCSYGPGRYDPEYEDKGHDYPVGFVRWTEQRNFEAVLDMMADSRLDVKPLISHRFEIGDAARAYEVVAGSDPSLGILLEYPGVVADRGSGHVITPAPFAHSREASGGSIKVSFVGAGNYASATLMPAFRQAGVGFRLVGSASGVSAAHAAGRFGFTQIVTDTGSLFEDSATDAVVIATRHDSHGALVVDALEAGKHVFTEKPLCIKLKELTAIEHALSSDQTRLLMVGFNRRFAPHVVRMHELLRSVGGPRAMVMTVNAGAVPLDHWTRDLEVGGGRLIGEACHFVDLLRHLAGSPIVSATGSPIGDPGDDSVSVQLGFADGSIGTIHYLANGSRAFPKERLEVFCAGRVLQLDNFRVLRGFGWPGLRTMRLWRQDKGQRACVAAFVAAVQSGAPSPIPVDELLEVSRTVIELAGAGVD